MGIATNVIEKLGALVEQNGVGKDMTKCKVTKIKDAEFCKLNAIEPNMVFTIGPDPNATSLMDPSGDMIALDAVKKLVDFKVVK